MGMSSCTNLNILINTEPVNPSENVVNLFTVEPVNFDKVYMYRSYKFVGST